MCPLGWGDVHHQHYLLVQNRGGQDQAPSRDPCFFQQQVADRSWLELYLYLCMNKVSAVPCLHCSPVRDVRHQLPTGSFVSVAVSANQNNSNNKNSFFSVSGQK